MKQPLKLASLMSENEDFIFDGLARYIQERTSAPVQVFGQIPWKERERLLDAGEIDIAWICGLPYVLRADRPDPGIELLTAPVMPGRRYRNQPIYFSDIVVHKDSQFHQFAELEGASWAYNDTHSHSGYNVVRYHLARLGRTGQYFGKVIKSGAHLASLRMILRKEVDAAAIDSVVLEIELRHRPELRSELRVIDTLGPSPIPPLVISKKMPSETGEAIRDLLVNMDTDVAGRAALAKIRLARLARVQDSDYDAIRSMYRKAKDVTL